MNRRTFITLIAAASAALATGAQASAPTVDVYKAAECGCCDEWVKHLRKSGFVVKVTVVPDTAVYRARAGIPPALGACHTAFVGGYAVEGHVPAADIHRLLAQRPAAKALVVPGMPQTSPGMDQRHGAAWDVLLIAADGSTKVFSSYPAR
jgi:hypothetical protein